MNISKTKIAFTTFLALAALQASAEDLSALGNATLREMNEDMVEELYERTGSKVAIPATLTASMSKSKTASDKKKLINNLNMMESMKSDLEARVADRKASPSFNDMVVIGITDIKVDGPRNYEFPNATTTPMYTIVRGDQVSNVIYSDFDGVKKNTGYSIKYRATYGEDGAVTINGTKIKQQGESKITFHVDVDDRDFAVSAVVSTSKNGWN